MKKTIIFIIIIFCVWLSKKPGFSNEINFVSQPDDSLFLQTYCWQPGNAYRPLLALDGVWEYSIDKKKSFKKVIIPASCDYRGKITFKKNFVPDSTYKDHFFRLICYGINYYCRIFVNDKFIGSHAGGYSSFAFDIPPGLILINQKNIIEIDVDTRLDSKKTIPHQFQPDGIKNTMGIFRSIYFLGVPELSIENVAHDYRFMQDFSQCELKIKFELKDRINNTTDPAFQNLHCYTELFEREGDRPLFQDRKAIDIHPYTLTKNNSVELFINKPQLWSPEMPFLYSVRIRLVSNGKIIDQVEQSLGLKQIIFRDGKIYLNGNRYILKGVNWAENYIIDGALLDRKQLSKDLELVKLLNANAIRILHHPAHPIIAELCDSHGLFLLQEIPLDWMPTSRLSAANFLGSCIDYFYEMVMRDRNHVSILAWGIGGHFQTPDNNVKKFFHRITERATDLTNIPLYT